MKTNVQVIRFRKYFASLALAFALVSSGANAAIEPHSLFLLAVDPDRAGVAESFALDLNLDSVATSPEAFTSISEETDRSALSDWLTHADASNSILWGVYGFGILSSEILGAGDLPKFQFFSTVNPGQSPSSGLTVSDVQGVNERGKSFIENFNLLVAPNENSIEAVDGAAGFPTELTENFGGVTNFGSRGGISEPLEMYRVGAVGNVIESSLLEGAWTLDAASGTVAFSAVPLPAAFWMFGAAIVGLYRRRRA